VIVKVGEQNKVNIPQSVNLATLVKLRRRWHSRKVCGLAKA
jgi:hypothetical protein